MFYDNVKRLCAEKGIAITALALQLGFSRSAPNAWKNLTKPPRIATVKKIAEYFNVPTEALLEDSTRAKSYTSEQSELSGQENEMLKLFRDLSVLDRAKALIYLSELDTKGRTEVK